MKDDQFNDIFKTKLENFEMDDFPIDGWEQIETKLPKGNVRSVWFTPIRIAAALLIGVLVTASVFYLHNTTQPTTSSALLVAAADSDAFADTEESLLEASISTDTQNDVPSSASVKAIVAKVDQMHQPAKKSDVMLAVTEEKQTAKNIQIAQSESMQVEETLSETEIDALNDQVSKKPRSESNERAYTKSLRSKDESRTLSYHTSSRKIDDKKWGFGCGAGAFASQSGSSLGMYTFKNSRHADKNLMLMNAASFSNQIPRSEIDHHTPLSVGLSVSRRLNDRFALQSGLVYSYLASDWKTNGVHHTKTKQSLHFIGVPISVVYKIAEWNKFLLYASAGGMCELNVKGNLRYKYYNNEELLSETNEGVRMAEPYWSVNAKAGVSYPLVKFVSLYVEAGADYYFKNNSDIETIRTEKPANFDFQFGLRFGL
ncbi:MAG: outer membrane beta-barrel protein [Tannerellaceae bacterium]